MRVEARQYFSRMPRDEIQYFDLRHDKFRLHSLLLEDKFTRSRRLLRRWNLRGGARHPSFFPPTTKTLGSAPPPNAGGGGPLPSFSPRFVAGATRPITVPAFLESRFP